MSTNYQSNKAKALMLAALNSGLKAVLVRSTFTPDKDTQFMSSATAAEVSTTGYTGAFGGSGRKTPANITITEDDSSDLGKLTFDAITWSNIGVPAGYAARYLLLIMAVTTDADSPIIATFDLNAGSDFTFNGGNFTFTPAAGGVLTVT